jgi:alkylation response protein AidB-like acyl-CoA dehydrogenase
MAKMFATEVAQSVVDAAVQIHGATALERGHLLEHLYRACVRRESTRGRRRSNARSSRESSIASGDSG